MKKFFKRFLQVIGVLLFEIIYIFGLGVYLIYYSNFFTTTRDMIVTTSMTTMTHQYFATFFLSDEKINEIIASTRLTAEAEDQDLSEVDTSKVAHDASGSLQGIEVQDVSTDTFRAYLMIIDDPSRVSLATAPSVGDVGSTTSQIVEHYNAVGGINAGGLADDAMGTGGTPTGLLIENGEYYNVNPYEYYSMCGFTQDNVLYVSDSVSKSTLDTLNLRCGVSFGPVLIVNGTPRIGSGAGWGIQPRTCIAQRQDGKVLFLVIDGRQKDSVGATLKNAQDILLNAGAYNAFNLDGGASSTMVFDSKVVNKPSDILGERYVPTAFIVK